MQAISYKRFVPLRLQAADSRKHTVTHALHSCRLVETLEVAIMNKDQTHGRVEQVKGKVNEAVGKVTNNPAKELKGDLQQAVGKEQANYGDTKEQVKKDIKRGS
jgi:uncharacterized protein YjbJ (UPF0337 family)